MGLRTALGLKRAKTKPSQQPKPVLKAVSQPPQDDRFTRPDWTSHHVSNWQAHLPEFVSKDVKILEVGSFEGRSALAFLDILPRSHITCVDPFTEDGREDRFDANLSAFQPRLRKIRGFSAHILQDLIAEQAKFDVIYIDGDHTLAGAATDSVLAWPLLRSGGIMIWDDYKWRPSLPVEERPQLGIDWFLNTFRNDLTILHQEYQVIARKM